MGFGNEVHNLMLLKQLNGNLGAVAEVLLTEDSNGNNSSNNNNQNRINNGFSSSNNERKKPNNIETQNMKIPVRTASIGSGKPFTPSPRSDSLKRSYVPPNYEYMNLLNQLKEMGFVDIKQMMAALNKVILIK